MWANLPWAPPNVEATFARRKTISDDQSVHAFWMMSCVYDRLLVNAGERSDDCVQETKQLVSAGVKFSKNSEFWHQHFTF